MNSNLPKTILIVLAVIMLLKSVWGIAHPSSLKAVGMWWARAALRVNTLCALAYFALAATLLTAVLIGQPLTNWLIVVFGALCAWAGTVFLKRREAETLVSRMIGSRSPAFMRIISIVSAMVAALLLYVAVKGI